MSRLNHFSQRGFRLSYSIALIIGFAFVVFAANVNAATFVVNTTADTQDAAPGNGTCADANGACSMRAAITEANALAGADVITLGAVTYTISLTAANEDLNAGGDFDITSPLTINGAGAATVVQANAVPNTATERVFHISGTGATSVTLNAMTIQNGKALDATDGGRGGGIKADGGTAFTSQLITLTNCFVKDNFADTRGAGITINKFNSIITNCTFTGNVAGSAFGTGGAGGAILIDSQDNVAVPTMTSLITNTVMTNNKAESSVANTFGGAVIVRAVDATVTFEGCTINNNISNAITAASFTGFAGGLYNQQAKMIVRNSSVSGNTSSHFHAGIRNLASTQAAATLDIIDSTISNNTSAAATGQGGGITNILGGIFDAIVNVDHSTISGNTLTGATSIGGGLINTGSAGGAALLTVTNSTVSGNSAADIGGIYSDGSAATCIIDFSTVANNHATNTQGGGIFQDTTAGGSTFVSNTISADNTANADVDINELPVSLDYNHFESPNPAFVGATNDVLTGDPHLAPLGNYGGLTQTHVTFSFSSPIVNKIPTGTNGCGSPINDDQRHWPRPLLGSCDKGSAENTFEGTPTSTNTSTPTQTPTASPTPTNTRTSTATTTPTATFTATGTRTSTNTPSNTPTASPTPALGFVVNTTSDTQDATPGNGTCADSNGACSLRAAITEANALAGPDIITLPAVTYTITLVATDEDANAGGDFDITSPITINGAGATTTIVQGAPDPFGAAERVFHVSGAGATQVTIRGITVRNGDAVSINTDGGRGGGIKVDGGSSFAGNNFTLADSIITNNWAATRGGGLSINKYNSTITGCTFSANLAGNLTQGTSAAGGAILIDSQDNVSVPTMTSVISDTIISDNKAQGSISNTFGGGVIVRAMDATVTFDRCLISGNLSQADNASFSGFAGGLYNQQAHMIVKNTTVSGNTSSHFHPGIRNLASTAAAATLDVINSTISNNTSSSDTAQGGGVTNILGSTFDATVNIDHSTISGNTLSGATSIGGGLINTGSAGGVALMTVTNSTVSGNSAADIGGIYSDGSAATCIIDFSTVANNSATNTVPPAQGGGIFQDTTAGGSTFVSNTISADNMANADVDINELPVSLDYNHFEAPNAAFVGASHDVLTGDPGLGALANNGGQTQTHSISFGSSALDRIPNGTNGCGSPVNDDQRHSPRPFAGSCDKGAFEFLFGDTPTATNTPTASPSPTNTRTATATRTSTATATPTPVEVSLARLHAPAGAVTVPITVSNISGLGIISYDFQVSFDPNCLQPASPAFDQTGTLSSTMTITANTNNPGHLIVSGFQAKNLTGAGTLINLKFNFAPIGTLGTSLIFQDYTDPGNIFHPGFQFNEGSPPVVTIEGYILLPPTPTTTASSTPSPALTATPTATGTPPGGPTPTITATATPTATGTPRRTAFDYDGDGKSDFSVFRPAGPFGSEWYFQLSQDGFVGFPFGVSSDKIVPADYNGDGMTDVVVLRTFASTIYWYGPIGPGSGYFGLPGDLPTPADYDGIGRAQLSVFRPSTGVWWRRAANGVTYGVQFGGSTSKPTIGDFDGDGKADIAVFSDGYWARINSSTGSTYQEQFGNSSDVAVPADYDGDGKADLAVFRVPTGTWYIRLAGGGYTTMRWGLSTDIPAPGDYDGDGKTDICVFRPSDGNWYWRNSSDGSYRGFHFGMNGDQPTQAAFRY
ncbi:MAG: CSLREA domain-containing protein [Chloracidobacterium sp.]|nr:CSLREA domain-containing protein [Chloracidobacterium sp.]